MAYPQKVVIVKSGEKDVEKCFLGYEFSNRRGNEGIHAIQKGRNIDECTKLFDINNYDNPNKASTYVYRAFKGDYTSPVTEEMQSHVNRVSLIDMLNFKRDSFEKNLSLVAKKKVEFNTKWDKRRLASFCQTNPGKDQLSSLDDSYTVSFIEMSSVSNEGYITYKEDKTLRQLKKGSYTLFQDEDIIIAKITPCMENGKCALARNLTNGMAMGSSEFHVLRTNNDIVINDYLFHLLNRQVVRDFAEQNMTGTSGHRRVPIKWYEDLDIPVPPIDVQKQIVEEIGKIEKSNNDAKSLIDKNLSDIRIIINGLGSTVSIEEYFDINTLTLNPTSCWKDEFFTYVDIDSVGKGDGNISFDNKILGKDAPSRARRVAEDRTVIVSTVRPYLKGFAYIESVPDKTIFSTGFALLKSKNEDTYISKLLYYLFMYSDDLMKQMETAMPKAAYPSINKEDIDNFKIPLLTIDEQERIVAQIEALELEITKARTLIENAASEKQAILDKYL